MYCNYHRRARCSTCTSSGCTVKCPQCYRTYCSIACFSKDRGHAHDESPRGAPSAAVSQCSHVSVDGRRASTTASDDDDEDGGDTFFYATATPRSVVTQSVEQSRTNDFPIFLHVDPVMRETVLCVERPSGNLWVAYCMKPFLMGLFGMLGVRVGRGIASAISGPR